MDAALFEKEIIKTVAKTFLVLKKHCSFQTTALALQSKNVWVLAVKAMLIIFCFMLKQQNLEIEKEEYP